MSTNPTATLLLLVESIPQSAEVIITARGTNPGERERLVIEVKRANIKLFLQYLLSEHLSILYKTSQDLFFP